MKKRQSKTKIVLSLVVLLLTLVIGIKIGISQGGAVQSHPASEIIGKVSDADKLDGFDTSTVPAANTVLVSDNTGKFPASAIAQGAGSGLDADKVDGYQAADLLAQGTGACSVMYTYGSTYSNSGLVSSPSCSGNGGGTGATPPALCPAGWIEAGCGAYGMTAVPSGSLVSLARTCYKC